MLPLKPVTRIAIATGLSLLLGTSCANFSSQKASLIQVDNLVGRVERVHVECELSRERMYTALDTLRSLVDPGFAGDPVMAYAEFVEAIELCEEEADVLRKNVAPMKSVADEIFARWNEDLEEFNSPGLRARSLQRMQETRARYDKVVVSAEAVQEAYDELNLALRDHALFLGNDFNAASLAAIRGDVVGLTQSAVELNALLEECLAHAQAYVDASALPTGPLDPSLDPAS